MRRRRTGPPWIPRGDSLSPAAWARRHRAVSALLAAHVPALVAFALLRGERLGPTLLAVAAPGALAVVACLPRLGRAWRCSAASLGLMLCSGALVELAHGLTEAHFHFFVMIPVVALYEAWPPFLVSTGYVLFQHGVVGTLAPHRVFEHGHAGTSPWVWAGVHGAAVGAICLASIGNWRAHELARGEAAALTGELTHRAAHDALTGLPNRATIQRQLTAALATEPSAVGVLFVDLSGLKPVNDTLGHAKGDAVLATVAERLTATVSEGGSVGRFGGEEFTVVTHDLEPAGLRVLADRVVRALDRPITAPDGGSVYLSASVGLAFGDAQMTADQLLASADLAMGAVKRRTGRGVQEFDTTLAEQATAQLAVERELREADLDRDLRAYHQPVVDLTTGTITGTEALLRWQHPARGLVPPGDFIPVAEQTGLIDELGIWVLTQACRDQVAWAAHDLTVAVNLSPRQLYDPGLAQRVAGLLAYTGARPDRLVLEVTESALIDDRVAGSALAALKDLGVGLALDDFGTGYSSLTSLRRYPFDTVKIDRSFVAEITRSPQDLAIVRNLVELSHDLCMTVVAEGIETAEQLTVLTAIGADSAQGYHLGRPAPAADLTMRLTPQPGAGGFVPRLRVASPATGLLHSP